MPRWHKFKAAAAVFPLLFLSRFSVVGGWAVGGATGICSLF